MWSPFVKRGQDVVVPPPSLDHSTDVNRPGVPPTYTYTQRREPHAGATYLAVPDSQYSRYTDNTPGRLGASEWQDAPDPVRQSNFFADGRKIHPHARMSRESKLNIAAITAISNQSMSVGKLKQFRNVPMYSGTQMPLVQRYNIAEGNSGTFGSQYEVANGLPSTQGVIMDNGMAYTQSLDGHPY